VNVPPKHRGKALVWVVRPGPPDRGREVLLLERPRDRGGGLHPVTGKAEPRETHAQCAAREAREETGITGPVSELGFEHRFVSAKPGKRPVEWTERAFVLEVPAGTEPRLSEEHVAHRWVPLGEAAAFLGWAAHRTAFERLVERLGEGQPSAGLR
jgi:8-oxo-dGTP pyrophosphatase MutT (NUDIX family)